MIQADLAPDRAHILLRFPYDANLVEKVKTIPGRRWSKPNCAWVIPFTAEEAQALPKVLEAGIEYSAALSKRLIELREQASVVDAVPQMPDDYTFPTTQPLAHQKRGLAIVAAKPYHAMFWEMRTGKTFFALAVLKRTRAAGRSLIVAPASVLHVWEDQAKIHQPDLKIHALTGTIKERALDIAHVDADALVINPEAVWRPDIMAAIRAEKWNCLFVDESHRFKHRSAQQTKALIKLALLFKRRYLLSGSPHDNNPLEVWSQMAILDPAILGSYYACRDRYCIMGGYQGKQVVAYRNLDELKAKLRPHADYVETKQCWDLPPRVDEVRRLDLNGDQETAYKQMAKELVAEINGQSIEATVLIAKLTKLRQILAGFAYDATGTPQKLKNNAKLSALREIIEDLPAGKKLVVWGIYHEELSLVAGLLEELGVGFVRVDGKTPIGSRPALIEKFSREPGVKAFIGHPYVGGIGLDLSSADSMVFLTNDLDRAQRLQAEARIVGPRQKSKQVTYIDLVCRGTWDVSALRLLQKKAELDNALTPERVIDLVEGK